MASGVVAAGHPLTAAAGADVLRAGGNAVDAALAAMLTSFVAEPLLTGLGAGGYMLVVGARTASRCCSTSSSRRPGAAPTSSAGRRSCRSTSRSATSCRCSTSAPPPCGVYGTPAGICVAGRALRHGPARRPRGARRRARARRCGGQRGAGVRVRDPRADLLLDAGGAGAATCPRGGVPRAGDVLRDPAQADALERLGAEGAAPFYEGDIGAAISDRVCELGGTLTRADLAAYRGRAARAGARPLPRPRRAHQPAAERGRHAARLRAGAARARPRGRPSRSRSCRRWSARRPSARRSSSTGLAEPGFLERFMASRLGLDDPHLGARRRRLGVLGHVHERRGLGHRRARHRRARQQHDGRAGPLAARLLHAPAGPAAAVDDGPDDRARDRRRAGAGAGLGGLEPHPLGVAAGDRQRDRRRHGRGRGGERRPRLHFEDGLVYAEPGHRRRPRSRPRATRSPGSATATCSSAAARRSSATRGPARSTAAAIRAAAAPSSTLD